MKLMNKELYKNSRANTSNGMGLVHAKNDNFIWIVVETTVFAQLYTC